MRTPAHTEPVHTEPALAPLARHAAGLTIGADPALRDRLRSALLDWGAALVAGTGHPLAPRYLKALLSGEETGPATVIGRQARAPLLAAAAANAAISHLWEVDDAHRDSTTHPGITVIPAVLALAEARALDAETTLAAITAGFEVVLRIGSHLGAAHYRICHSTATAGTLGAAAGAARAMGLDAQHTLWALGHAGTQAAGLWAFLDAGADAAKGFHAATAVRNGLAAAHLAEAGIPGAATVLEGPRGMRAAWGLEGCDPAWLIPGDRALIHQVTIKGWPVCGQMHTALDCALALAKAHPDVAASDCPVSVDLPRSALDIAGRRNPATVAEAKFATAFCIAATLCGRAPTITGLTPALLADPVIHARAAQITVQEDPAFTARFPAERPARVSLLCHGRPLTEERRFRRGDPEAPWSASDMERRTREVLSLTGAPTDAQALITWADALATGDTSWRAAGLFAAAPLTRNELKVHA